MSHGKHIHQMDLATHAMRCSVLEPRLPSDRVTWSLSISGLYIPAVCIPLQAVGNLHDGGRTDSFAEGSAGNQLGQGEETDQRWHNQGWQSPGSQCAVSGTMQCMSSGWSESLSRENLWRRKCQCPWSLWLHPIDPSECNLEPRCAKSFASIYNNQPKGESVRTLRNRPAAARVRCTVWAWHIPRWKVYCMLNPGIDLSS